MSAPPNPSNATFAPLEQDLTLLLPDGLTPLPVPLPDLQAFMLYTTHLALTYAAQLGATLLLLPLLLILTPSAKRQRPIFLLNLLALVLNSTRLILMSLYLTSGFSHPYAYFAGYYDAVPRADYTNSVAASVFTLLLLLAVEASLVLQARVVCLTLPVYQQRVMLAASAAVASVAVGFRAALVAENVRAILAAADFRLTGRWLGSATNITATVSIWFFCGVFVGKLVGTMRERKRMGMRQLRAVRVVAVGGVGTMIVPAVFAVLAYFTNIPDLGTVVLTLVAVFLPLSSLWASARIDGTEGANSGGANHFFGSDSSGSRGRMAKPFHFLSSGASGSQGWRKEKKNGHPSASGETTMVSGTTASQTLGSVSSARPLKGEEGLHLKDLECGMGPREVDLEAGRGYGAESRFGGVTVQKEVSVTSEGI